MLNSVHAIPNVNAMQNVEYDSVWVTGNKAYIGWQRVRRSILDGRKQCLYRMAGNNVYMGWQGTMSI